MAVAASFIKAEAEASIKIILFNRLLHLLHVTIGVVLSATAHDIEFEPPWGETS